MQLAGCRVLVQVFNHQGVVADTARHGELRQPCSCAGAGKALVEIEGIVAGAAGQGAVRPAVIEQAGLAGNDGIVSIAGIDVVVRCSSVPARSTRSRMRDSSKGRSIDKPAGIRVCCASQAILSIDSTSTDIALQDDVPGKAGLYLVINRAARAATPAISAILPELRSKKTTGARRNRVIPAAPFPPLPPSPASA